MGAWRGDCGVGFPLALAPCVRAHGGHDVSLCCCGRIGVNPAENLSMRNMPSICRACKHPLTFLCWQVLYALQGESKMVIPRDGSYVLALPAPSSDPEPKEAHPRPPATDDHPSHRPKDGPSQETPAPGPRGVRSSPRTAPAHGSTLTPPPDISHSETELNVGRRAQHRAPTSYSRVKDCFLAASPAHAMPPRPARPGSVVAGGFMHDCQRRTEP